MILLRIIDSHVHLHVSDNDKLDEYNFYNILDLLNDQQKYKINKSVCFLNPFVPELLCKVNCKHRIRIVDKDDKELQIYCENCEKIIYSGIDPLRLLNIQLLKQTREIKSIIPFVYLNISKAINSEVRYFEQYYGDLVMGYKIHPKLCSRHLSSVTINSNKPIIVHTGVQEETSPADIIKFAKNYKGDVILAHCARFSEKDLLIIKNTSNLYIDISPFLTLYKSIKEKSNTLYDISYFGKINNPTDLLQKLINYVGINKIVFGTDAPFTNFKEELEFILNCDIIKADKEKILFNNFYSLLHKTRRVENEKNSKQFAIKAKEK